MWNVILFPTYLIFTLPFGNGHPWSGESEKWGLSIRSGVHAALLEHFFFWGGAVVMDFVQWPSGHMAAAKQGI